MIITKGMMVSVVGPGPDLVGVVESDLTGRVRRVRYADGMVDDVIMVDQTRLTPLGIRFESELGLRHEWLMKQREVRLPSPEKMASKRRGLMRKRAIKALKAMSEEGVERWVMTW